jgi:hypothetical protein
MYIRCIFVYVRWREIDEDASFGEAMTHKSLASARASLDQHLY